MFNYFKNLVYNLFFYKKKFFENKPNWSNEEQSIPPNFGKAKIINHKNFKKIINQKSEIRKKNINNERKYNDKVSIIILTCKREYLLEQLLDNLTNFLNNYETYKKVELIVADNGSDFSKNSYLCKKYKISKHFFFKKNIGMSNALRKVYSKINSSYILFLEDDFLIKYQKPFIKDCIDIFNEYKDIGIIRLKNQNNWWKPSRIIAPKRTLNSGVKFWTWIPNEDLNGWCAGSVMFKKSYYDSVGSLPISLNVGRFQFFIYENYFAKKFNKYWNAAKIENCYPFIQNNKSKPIK